MLTNSMVAPTLPAVDLERAKKFYTEKLGLILSAMAMPGGAIFDCGGGTHIILYQRGMTKADHTAASFLVEDVEKTKRELEGKGVMFEEYDMPGLKTINGIAAMGSSKSAWFKDTEGNILSITQM